MVEIELKPKESANDSSVMLGIMLDTLESINNTDDIPTFNIKLKLITNIDFIIDNLMDQYMHGK